MLEETSFQFSKEKKQHLITYNNYQDKSWEINFKNGSVQCLVTHYRTVLDPQERSPGAARCQFAVSHLLQTHSLNNDPSDRKTQVWGCEFEPDPERKGLFGHCDLKYVHIVSCLYLS